MTIRKTLTSIVLAGALALGTAGCNRDHSQYKYYGKIGEEQVTFIEKEYLLKEDDNILTVIKSDGRIIRYVDKYGDDLVLEYVKITANGSTIKYIADDEVGKSILKESQKQFDIYLEDIKKQKLTKS